MFRQAILEQPCSRCDAAKGKRCVTKNGYLLDVVTCHIERRRYAKEKVRIAIQETS
jgi:hypothetical protein